MPARLLNLDDEGAPPPRSASAGPQPGDIAITDKRVEDYLNELHYSGDATLLEMERHCEAEHLPVVGPVVGMLLRQLAQTLSARDIFEMGAGIGYATIYLARAVGEGGRVVHSDLSAAHSQHARGFLGQAGLLDRVSFEVGDAVKVLSDYPGPFDLIFINIDKARYPEALELARPRVRPGGYIVVNGVLWCGRVFAAGPRDLETLAVLRYTRAALAAPDLLTTFLPVRDGLALHLKLPEARRRR